MKFASLYRENKKAAEELLTSMWCSEPRNPRQEVYAEKIKGLINTELFASEKYMPLVQCMDLYESSSDEEADSIFKSIDSELWYKSIAPKTFNPYRHQVRAWEALTNVNGPKNSMVVTTGTGSGKTECFMIPLVDDLLKQQHVHQIQAIFLYPLNALMEDQKERLQKLLAGTHLKFAVYNGNMPNDEGDPTSKSELERNEAKRIREERKKYPNLIPTRKEMYDSAPNIILTNPTMLEYMLLRQKDQKLFTEKSLRWVVIDETHTFSGAGAAELSMLLRRVLDAFSLDASEIRFATSSATIGNATTQEEEDANNKKLLEFISMITRANIEQVKLITGKRNVKASDAVDPEVARCRELLQLNDYIELDELMPGEGETIEDKLNRLDELCSLSESPLKAKVHFFYRVPNNGLRVQLNDSENGIFNIKTAIPVNQCKTPYLELMRCQHCGEYFAVGESVPGYSRKYRALTASADDLFTESNNGQISRLVFGLTERKIVDDARDGDHLVAINDDEYENDDKAFTNGWSVVQNVKYCCPHCHARVLGKEDKKNDGAENSQKIEEQENAEANENARSFRIQAPLISRTIAPSILNQLKTSADPDVPHKGQQFISFVDSRKSAAESTLKQNLQQERLWVYSRVFNVLNKKRAAASAAVNSPELQKLEKKYRDFLADGDNETAELYKERLDKKRAAINDVSLSWNEIFDLLIGDNECEWLAYQFVNKGTHTSEINADTDTVLPDSKAKYLLSIMIELLAHRPRQSAAPETMGYISTTYPKLNVIKEIPRAVTEFNESFLQGRKPIDLTEWKNLLKLYLDNVVRSNQSIYLKQSNSSCIDIFACQRYGTKKSPRRPVFEPNISDDAKTKSKFSAVAGLLGALIPNPGNMPLADVVFNNRAAINKVLKALWETLTETTALLQISQKYADGSWQVDVYKDEDDNQIPSYRLNVIDISFKATECACLVDSRSPGRKYQALRPVDTLFMGYSPYIIEGKVHEPVVKMQTWSPYPYVDGMKDDCKVTYEDILAWAKDERSILCENGIWGEDGCFADRLNNVFSYPDIFIQAEHTAQVNKLISRHSQEMFKKQKLNVLACSTTMEMGVDLGNLELVLMTSIPPHPTNYKQRAGRSGRNDDTRSACITLCGSDAVGLRTLYYPMEQLINRKMQVPSVDLQSPQVIQRHANAFLFRSSGVFFKDCGSTENNLGQELISFFTPYMFDINVKNKTFVIRSKDAESREIYPNDGLGDVNRTTYYEFLNYLNGGEEGKEGTNNLEDHKRSLNKILKDTCFEQGADGCVERCKSDIRGIYDSLETKVRDIADSYTEEKERLLNSGNQADKNKVVGAWEVNSGYGYLLRHKFSECLNQNMLTFLATNRFTPNANMPVDIIEYSVNLKRNCDNDFTFRKSNNPSYPLHEAISQYVPGNTVTTENKTSIIRGIAYTGQFKQTYTFKTIYSDGNNTVIDFKNRLESQPKEWPISNAEELTLIEPTAFIPDINEDYTRVLDRNTYTQVSAQLIGAGTWQSGDSNSMIAMRSNRDCCEAKILYYNEGLGYGYCFCPSCGKTVLETKPAIAHFDIPEGMQNQKTSDGTPFHYHIDRKDYKRSNRGYRIPCYPNKIFRNVILGGLIQTDYCEIKLKDFYGNWISRSPENDRLLITLGILFTKAYTEYINKDRNDVSFALMPNGHLCIFDTNPGGSGYSNELAGQRVMGAVVDKSIEILNELKSKDAILDKFTLRYLDRLDIDTARKWILELKKSMVSVPEVVSNEYPQAKVAVIEDIYRDFRSYGMTNCEKTLFVNSVWDKWLYKPEFQSTQDLTMGFKQRTHDIRYKAVDIKVVVTDAQKVPVPICRMMLQIEEWGKIFLANNVMKKGFMPLAIIGDTLYFTTNKVSTNANFDWARCDVYYMPRTSVPEFSLKKYDINFDQPHIKKFVLDKNDHANIMSKDLGALIESRITGIVGDFFDHCNKYSNKCISVKYQDEHLKSPVAMVTTLQFIEHFLKKVKNSFTLEFINEIYDEIPRGCSVFSNLTNDIDRNDVLDRISDGWKDDISQDGMMCKGIKINTLNAKTLPHWRNLVFECEGKALYIYPNGGIINEWFEDRARTRGIHYTVDDISTEDNIPLRRYNEIMYDAEIQDI